MESQKRIKKEPTKEVYSDITPKMAEVYSTKKSLPQRNKENELEFEDFPDFRPNLTPQEVIQMGSFGGTYFRSIYSGVLKQNLENQHLEFPQEWFKGLNIKREVISSKYNNHVNKYKVKCGGSLEMWESSGWINPLDPYGWFQWYCRFYQGRRSSDDERQISRGLQCMGPTGRWRIQLYNKCIRANTTFDDINISPVVRQVLQHWGYQPNLKDFLLAKKSFKK